MKLCRKIGMAEENPVTNRRKKLLINPDFQLKFIRNLLYLNILICGIFYMAQSYFFWQGKELGNSVPLPPNHVFFRFLEEQQRSMTMISLITMIVVSVLIGAFALVYSHRIAGPIYKLQKYLRERAAGTEKGAMYLRQNDYFQEMAESVNDFVNSEKVVPLSKNTEKKNLNKKESKSRKKAA